MPKRKDVRPPPSTRRKARPRGKQSSRPEARQLPIVGIGASAGGLDALERLLKSLPAGGGMAFLVVQHLDPKHESRLTEILARATPLPVAEVTDRMRIQPNSVYVIPPNVNMLVRNGVLRLSPRDEPMARHHPIDFLFRSLAASQKNRAIGVVLSGTASDGALGIEAIKAEGGITFAQDAASAKYFGMPHSSIVTGAVDFVLPPEGIATYLARIGRHPYLQLVVEDLDPTPAGRPDDPLSEVLQLLRKSFGVDFASYKASTVGRRIRRRMALRAIEELSDYVRYLRKSPEELRELHKDMFIGVTGFFREPETFVALQKSFFPRLLKERAADAPIRIWVPGCSTGEEVYSLAIT